MMRNTTIIAIVALASLLVAPGCTSRVPPLMGGEDAVRLVGNSGSATKIEAYRIDGMAGWSNEETDPRPKIHAYPIISGPVPVDDATAAMLADVLTDDSTYLWDIAKACEFLPGVALRYHGDGIDVDVLLCFSCDELEVYRNGAEVGHEDFDPRRADLVRIAKRLFPEDETIKGLRE
jgi:hypothetical protein